MQVKVNLTGMLKSKTPPGGRLELADGATIAQAIAALDIPAEQIQIVMVGGKHQHDRSRKLSDGDEMTILALVGGG